MKSNVVRFSLLKLLVVEGRSVLCIRKKSQFSFEFRVNQTDMRS